MAADNFSACWAQLLGNEGGYVDNPNDPGGATIWGVTEAVARANGYTGDMRLMSQATAESIAKREYWDVVQGDDLPAPLDFQVLDGAYNSGAGRAAEWLQQAVGVQADGQIGPVTLAAVGRLPVSQIICGYNGARLAFLASLGTWPDFGRGWANRIAHNLTLAGNGKP